MKYHSQVIEFHYFNKYINKEEEKSNKQAPLLCYNLELCARVVGSIKNNVFNELFHLLRKIYFQFQNVFITIVNNHDDHYT